MAMTPAGFRFSVFLCFCNFLLMSHATNKDKASYSADSTTEGVPFLLRFLGNSRRQRRQLEAPQDVIYVIDSSSSVSRSEFTKATAAVRMLARKASPDTRHAAVTIATRAHVIFNFTTMATADEILANLQRSGGKTNTQEALATCVQMFQNRVWGKRAASFKRILLITDGQSNIAKERTIHSGVHLKLLGVEVFIVAVGEYSAGLKELTQLASSPYTHLYRVTNIRDLVQLVKLVLDEQERRQWLEEIAKIQEDIGVVGAKM